MSEEMQMVAPRHQDWAMNVFAHIRSDLVPDFINKLKISDFVTPESLLNIAKHQISQHKFNEAGLMIVRYKFFEHFDIPNLMLKLVDLNKSETAKLLAHD